MIRKVTHSVLLGLAAVVALIWVVTLIYPDPLCWQNHDRFLKPGHRSVSLSPGGFCLAFTDEVDTQRASSWNIGICRVTVLDVYSHAVNDGAAVTILAPRTILVYLHFPLILGLLLAYPAYRAARAGARRLARKAGACRTCGYNLTGNESGVCPECGETE